MFLSIRTLAPIALSLALISLTSCQSASKEGKTTFSVESKVTNKIAPQMASRIKRILSLIHI